MRKPRKTTTAEERDKRHRLKAQEMIEGTAAAEEAVDARIRRNIELHGP